MDNLSVDIGTCRSVERNAPSRFGSPRGLSAGSSAAIRVVDSGWTYPLSFLLFLVTLSSVFFALWSASPTAAIGMLFITTPGLLRTMWIVERQRLAGVSVPFRAQVWLLLSSSATILFAGITFAILFLLTLSVIVAAGVVFGLLFLNGDRAADGAVMGVVIGLPVGSAISAFLSVALIRLAWGGYDTGPVDMRN